VAQSGVRASELALTCLVGAAGGMVPPAAAVEVVPAELAALPNTHGFAGCFGLSGGRLLVAGGANFPDGVMPWDGGTKVWHRGVFALDPARPDAGWSRVGELPAAAGYGVSVTLPTGVLLVGGGDATAHSGATRLMRWVDGKVVFTELAPLPVPLANACGAVVDGKVHVVGGITRPDATVANARHFVFDPSAAWTELPPLPGDGVMLATAAAAADGTFIVAGGCSLKAGPDGKPVRTYLRKCWKFAHGEWTAAADLPRAAVGAASPGWVRDGQFIVVGGDDGTQAGGDPRTHRGFCRNLLAYVSAADRWTAWPELIEGLPVTLPGVEAGGGYLLVSGEIRPGVRTPRVIQLRLTRP
jgi:N-acetylneuraminic acid mutarotase